LATIAALSNQSSGSRSQLKVRTRLYGGFLIVIGLAVALASTGTWGISRLGEQITKIEVVDGAEQRMLTMIGSLENIGRAQIRYMFDGDEISVGDMRDAQTKVKAVLETSVANTTMPARLALYASLSTRLDEQAAGSVKLVELVNTAREARVRQDKDGDILTATTDTMMQEADAVHDEAIETPAVAAEHAVLLVRIAGLRFRASPDGTGPSIVSGAMDKADRALVTLDHAADVMDHMENSKGAAALHLKIVPVREALAAYGKDFNTVSVATLAQLALFQGTLKPLVIGMRADLAKAEEDMLRNSTAAGLEAHDSMIATAVSQLVIAGAGVVLGLGLAFFIARGILGPLAGMTAAMARLANGDQAVDIPARENSDEIGDMARAVEVFKQNSIAAVRLAAEQAAEQGVKQRRADVLGGLVRDFESKLGALADGLASGATKLETTASSMSDAASQANGRASSVASAAQQMSANIQTVSASAEELGASIGEISRQVSQSSEITGRAAQDAERTDAIVRELSEGAQRIGDVVSLISSIAGQTNLLALNATIEAARAGDAGKGFAVVASEVKSLANQTAKATEDIAKQVNQIQTATRSAVEAIHGIVSTIGEVSRIATGISAAVEEQGAATREIARSVQQAAIGAQDVTGNISVVSQAANNAGAAASEVLGASGQLSRQADELSKEVGQFIAGVRAA
jgi:methyl-accepting chemotaxis protein